MILRCARMLNVFKVLRAARISRFRRDERHETQAAKILLASGLVARLWDDHVLLAYPCQICDAIILCQVDVVWQCHYQIAVVWCCLKCRCSPCRTSYHFTCRAQQKRIDRVRVFHVVVRDANVRVSIDARPGSAAQCAYCLVLSLVC